MEEKNFETLIKEVHEKAEEKLKDLRAEKVIYDKMSDVEYTFFRDGMFYKRERYIVWFKCKDLKEAAKVLNSFPVKEGVTETITREMHIKSPFTVYLHNSCRGEHNLSISYLYEDLYEIRININPEFLIEFFERTSRNLSDTEYHYYIGHSMSELKGIKVGIFKFKKYYNSEDIKPWYKGEQTLLNVEGINTIIKTVRDAQ